MLDNKINLNVKPAIQCRFVEDGTILEIEGGFLTDFIQPNKNIQDICEFLIGTLNCIRSSSEVTHFSGMHITDGESNYIVDAQLIFDEKKAQYVLLLEDETKLYRAINQLSQQRNEADILKNKLQRQNHQLEMLKVAAESASQTRTQFLAKMSHDVRTPLNALLGFSQLLHETALSPDQTRHISHIQAAGKTLSALLNDILDLSRMEAGKFYVSLAPFNLTQVLQEVQDMVRQLADKKNLELIFEKNSEIPELLIGDSLRISQIALNLLTNAIKFTDQGGVTLRVHSTTQTDSTLWVTISVTDSGRGIDAEYVDTIFEAFSQEKSEDASEFGGLGLGLAIVNQLAEAMDGKISVESSKGSGSTFTFELPLYFSETKEINEKLLVSNRETTELELKDTTILIVEDNVLNQQYTREIFSQQDCEILVAETGEAAIQALLTFPIDLVVMDINMPKMNGDVAVAKIRNTLLYPLNQVPIIMMSGSVTKDQIQKCLEYGANAVLQKPFKKAEMLSKVKQVISATGIEKNLEVDTRLSDDISAEMIEIYKRYTPQYLREMVIALFSQQETQFKFQAHKLQSAMWVMEYMQNYELLERLESEPFDFEECLPVVAEVCRSIENSLLPVNDTP